MARVLEAKGVGVWSSINPAILQSILQFDTGGEFVGFGKHSKKTMREVSSLKLPLPFL